jgi:hypothetical protein
MVDGPGIFGIFGWQEYMPEIPELNSGIPNTFSNKCSGFSGSKYTCSGLGILGFGIWFYARSELYGWGGNTSQFKKYDILPPFHIYCRWFEIEWVFKMIESIFWSEFLSSTYRCELCIYKNLFNHFLLWDMQESKKKICGSKIDIFT